MRFYLCRSNGTVPLRKSKGDMGEYNAIEVIRKVAGKLKDKKLANLKTVETEIRELGEYLGLNAMQTVLFIAIFDRQCGDSRTDISDISYYFGISTIDVLEHKADIDRLLEMGIIRRADDYAREFTKTNFKVDRLAFESILDRKPVKISAAPEFAMDRFDFVKAVGNLVENRRSNDMDTDMLLETVSGLEHACSAPAFIEDMKSQIPDLASRVFFYDCCHDFINDRNDNSPTDLNVTLEDIYDRTGKIMSVKRKFAAGTHPLLSAGLLECWEDGTDYKLALSDAGRQIFLREDIHLFSSERNLDRYTFVREVESLIDERESRHYPTARLHRKILALEKRAHDLPLVKAVQEKLPDSMDRAIFYAVCRGLTGRKPTADSLVESMFDDERTRIVEKQKFIGGSHVLLKQELVELGSAGFFGGVPLELTETGKELFLGEDFDLFTSGVTDNGFLQPDTIKEKRLFFTPELESQLSFLRDSLREGNYDVLKTRLAGKALPSGVAALFYGDPGTGKTESVYQIAKALGKSVMQVDISEMKTCWYGESQKLVRGVFKRYARACRHSSNVPILFFNEADAIFGRRTENPGQSVDQTENAIQNIILEEMEKLDGIMVATTNLEGNLDPAFERRFLFKVRFERPGADAVAKIWRDKLPDLAESQAKALAEDYDFSGGEIDNIVRKAVMNEVLYGEKPDFERLRTLCSQERISGGAKGRRIGF